jgi:hypothetical protein
MLSKFLIACSVLVAATALMATGASAGRGAVPQPGTWRWPPYAEGGNMPRLSSEPKCNTPADLIIGTVDQDLRECCRVMLFAFIG